MEILHNVSLKNYNTFGVEAYAKYLVEVNSVDEINHAIDFAFSNDLKILVINGGSNILFTQDWKGLVIKINLKGIELVVQDEFHAWVKVQSGENWDSFVRWTLEQNLGGLENLSLIPGNCGTAPMQNIGAYGVEIKDVLSELTALEISTRTLKRFSNSECHFGYRESIFKNELKNQYIIVDVTFKLSKNNHQIKTSYGAIQSELANLGIDAPTIQDVSKAVVNIRQSKLPDPSKIGNSGSFFKNPVISDSHFQKLQMSYPSISGYPVQNGTKVAAGWLIETAGWKGFREIDAGVHSKQALVLVNYGQATGKEIFNLSQKIIQDIQDKFEIELEREVNVI